MLLFSKFMRYLLVLVGVAILAILVFAWKVGLFSVIPLLQLKIPEGPIEPHMFELRDLYQRGSGIDNAVSEFIREHKDVYLEPTIGLLGRSAPDTEEEEIALFFADRYSEDCSVRKALLERVLGASSNTARTSALSLMHQTWDAVGLFPDSNLQVSTQLIRFHDAPAIEDPPDSWRSLGAMQYQGFFDEHIDYEAGIRFAASQLSSEGRLELAYWLVSVTRVKPSNDLVMQALEKSGSDYSVVLEGPGEDEMSDHLSELATWITEAELAFVSEGCGLLSAS